MHHSNLSHVRIGSAVIMSLLLLVSTVFSMTASAAVVPTQSVIHEQVEQYDRDQLMQVLNENGVKDQLTALGVDPEQVEQRIQTLTGDELAQLNDQIQNMPAGQGAVGVLLTLFIVFVVTDMLCATNVFSFVACINK